MSKQLEHEDLNGFSPWERVRLANIMAAKYSMDVEMRRLAGHILRRETNVPANGSRKIAKWIRKNFLYQQESPGTEILQGPYSTLYSGVLDCDDAAILFTTLTRAAGIHTYFLGIGKENDPGEMLHAVGLDVGTGMIYELIDDRAYGNLWKNGLVFRFYPGYFGVYYAPEPDVTGFYSGNPKQGFKRVTGPLPRPAEEKSMSSCYGCGMSGMGGETDTLYGVFGGGDPAEEGSGKETGVGGTSPGGSTSGGTDTEGEVWETSRSVIEGFFDWATARAAPEGYGGRGAPDAQYGDWAAQDQGEAPKDYTTYYLVGGIAAAGLLVYLMTKD